VKRFSHRNHSFEIAKAGGMDNSVVSEEIWVIDKGKKKKLVKKAQKGEVNCIEQYSACVRNDIVVTPSIQWKQRVENGAGHDVSVNELRDFLVSVLSHAPSRKYVNQSSNQIVKLFSVSSSQLLNLYIHIYSLNQLARSTTNLP
jgi:hypothetical protein